MRAETLEGGFANAPLDAARAFRVTMSVMARPGRIEMLNAARPPAPVSAAAGTLILTLCDHETGIYLASNCDTPEVRSWIAFHTGAPIVSPDVARFALGRWTDLVPLGQYSPGTPEYPDRSTTLIVETDVLEPQGAVLSGPGIRDTARLSVPDVSALQDNAARFPLGLDFFLTCADRVAGLPRSTKLEGLACM